MQANCSTHGKANTMFTCQWLTKINLNSASAFHYKEETMKNKFALCMILILICSAFSFANEFQTSPSKMVGSHSSDFRLNNNIVRFGAGGSYGKVASDREAINNNTFKTFKSFRGASIGMFVSGSLIGMPALISFITMYMTIYNVELALAGGVAETALSATNALLATGGGLIGLYTIAAFGILSGLLLTAGIAFAIVAGVFHYKWQEEKGITAYNAISSDKPQFAQGFRVLL